MRLLGLRCFCRAHSASPWTLTSLPLFHPDFIRAVALAVIAEGMWMTRTVVGVAA